MRAIEAENPDLKDVLPKTYNRFENALLKELLKTMNSVPMDIEGDAFGKIYEYFLGNFAMSEGQKGGEFFTPTAIVQLIVDIIEPFHGRIFDPACGSGGMFVQSARFVEEHKKNPGAELSVYGQEKVAETVRLGKMNLAVHGLAGDIRQGNAYYEDLHRSAGKFDFVMANPPFNVDRVDKDRLKDDPRFPFGLPRTDNANYLWIQLFYSALNDTGRAGFVMANSASDARGSELEIRQQLIAVRGRGRDGRGRLQLLLHRHPALHPLVPRPGQAQTRTRRPGALHRRPPHLPPDRPRPPRLDPGPDRVPGQHRPALPGRGAREPARQRRPAGRALPQTARYADVPGLCKVATLAEIEAQGWSLNPGRYVGVAARAEDDFDFKERLEELNEELEILNAEARELEERIAENVAMLLEAE